MIAFLALLFVLLIIYGLTKTKEGFNPMNTSPEHQINIPVDKIPSMLNSPPATKESAISATGLPVGNTVSEPASNGSIFPGCDVKSSTWPGMLPGPLPTAPYEQIAVGSPLPYQDTTLIKANRQQLINMLEMIKGFLAFEAQEISERSDPTIQLPLQTARTDFHVLQMEVGVLNRNPGIQPTITLSHLNEISSNLAFLQREVRLIGSAGPIQGPIYEFTKPVEGFVDAAVKPASRSSGATTISSSYDTTSQQPRVLSSQTTTNDVMSQSDMQKAIDKVNSASRVSASGNTRAPQIVEDIKETSETITIGQSQAAADKAAKTKAKDQQLLNDLKAANEDGSIASAPTKTAQSGPAPFDEEQSKYGPRATLKELEDFIVKIQCEVVRLGASATTDDVTDARITALQQVKSAMKTIKNKVKSGQMPESQIPVFKSDLDKAFPILGKKSEPLPQLIKYAGLPAGLANLLPSNMQNDPEVSQEIGSLINKYFDTFMNGVSFSVKYTSPREAEAGSGRVVNDNMSEQFVNSLMEKKRRTASTIDKSGFPSLADLDNASNAKFSPMDSGLLITDPYAPLPSDAGRGPSHFDWRVRSKEIEGQVKKRGLKPSDFGIMPSTAKVSNDFSWKGYARMMCTRLQATMDPNLPVACGCPPMDWSGWRN